MVVYLNSKSCEAHLVSLAGAKKITWHCQSRVTTAQRKSLREKEMAPEQSQAAYIGRCKLK